MFTGRAIILTMSCVGILLLAGYEVLRRGALPGEVTRVEDLGGPGTFDRLYTFGGSDYRVRLGEGEPIGGAGTYSVSRTGPEGGAAIEGRFARPGSLREVHFLDVDAEAPPSLVVILEEPSSPDRATGVILTPDGDRWREEPLGGLPESVAPRHLGNDSYEKLGAFLYRTSTFGPRIEGDDPEELRFFLDWRARRWELAD